VRIGRLHERIISCLAGQAVQRRHSPSSVRSYNASSDRAAVADLLFCLHAENEIPRSFVISNQNEEPGRESHELIRNRIPGA
jgi:hypothetical protein